MAKITDVLARARPAERHVEICLDGTISARLEALEADLTAAVAWDDEHNEPPTAPAVRAAIEALRGEAATATVTFTLQAVGSTTWRRLVAEHPPPPGEEDQWRWDPIGFPIAAVAATSADPKMTVEEAAELADRLTEGQFTKLFNSTLGVNLGDDVPKFGPATEAGPTFELRSITAAPEASPTASSPASADSPAPASSSGASGTA